MSAYARMACWTLSCPPGLWLMSLELVPPGSLAVLWWPGLESNQQRGGRNRCAACAWP